MHEVKRMCVVGALCVTLASAALAAETEGFVRLYNGKDLTGWGVINGKIDAWKADGELLSCVHEGGGWLRTKDVYSDFVLKFEFRLPKGGNSGVGLRFPILGNPAHEGMEVQLLDDDDPQYKGLKDAQYTGGIYYQAAAERGHLKKVGEWNSMEITCAGQHVTVVLNGKKINDVHLDKKTRAEGNYLPLSKRPQVGYVGFQCHDTRVDFRNVELKNLMKLSPHGVRYFDLVEGTGKTVQSDSTIKLHYTGWLLNGNVFDDSRKNDEPVNFEIQKLIEGWKDAIPGMKVGGRRKLLVPAKLGYGTQGTSKIPPNADLLFDVEILDVE